MLEVARREETRGMQRSSRGDLIARLVGMLVFLLGVGVICVVLSMALEMFHDPNLGMKPATGSAAPNITDVGTGFAKLVLRIGLLFFGSLSGSMIANRGIQLYFSSLHARPGADPPQS